MKVYDPTLTCNAEEADTRLWLHVIKSVGLIYSPDTDTLFIGMGIVNTITTNVVIQISKEATNKKFIHKFYNLCLLSVEVTSLHSS